MKRLKPSSDRKVRFYDEQYNTFGLLPGPDGTCPGCTTTKKGCWFVSPGRKTPVCYVHNLMRIYNGVRDVLEHNTTILREASASSRPIMAMRNILEDEFERFVTAERKRATITGKSHLLYRLHWSGDIFSPEYAEALRLAMSSYPDVRFWCYTRSFFAASILGKTQNLIQYLSIDPVNALQGIIEYDECDGQANSRLRLCYMGAEADLPEIRDNAEDVLAARNEIRLILGGKTKNMKWMRDLTLRACPVSAGKLPTAGGCATCGRCFGDTACPVWFVT